MYLSLARKYADKLVEWLSPHCTRIRIAGSIRRNCRDCNDIDIVCVPKISSVQDLLGSTGIRENQCLKHVQAYVRENNPTGQKFTPPFFISGGDKEGKQSLIQLPKCQLDLWFADEETFASRLLCRTGSKEHNIWIAERANSFGLHWAIYSGMSKAGIVIPTKTEEEIYALLSLPFIAPENRHRQFLQSTFNHQPSTLP